MKDARSTFAHSAKLDLKWAGIALTASFHSTRWFSFALNQCVSAGPLLFSIALREKAAYSNMKSDYNCKETHRPALSMSLLMRT